MGQVDERRQRDAEARQHDVETQRQRHLVASRHQLTRVDSEHPSSQVPRRPSVGTATIRCVTHARYREAMTTMPPIVRKVNWPTTRRRWHRRCPLGTSTAPMPAPSTSRRTCRERSRRPRTGEGEGRRRVRRLGGVAPRNPTHSRGDDRPATASAMAPSWASTSAGGGCRRAPGGGGGADRPPTGGVESAWANG